MLPIGFITNPNCLQSHHFSPPSIHVFGLFSKRRVCLAPFWKKLDACSKLFWRVDLQAHTRGWASRLSGTIMSKRDMNIRETVPLSFSHVYVFVYFFINSTQPLSPEYIQTTWRELCDWCTSELRSARLRQWKLICTIEAPCISRPWDWGSTDCAFMPSRIMKIKDKPEGRSRGPCRGVTGGCDDDDCFCYHTVRNNL